MPENADEPSSGGPQQCLSMSNRPEGSTGSVTEIARSSRQGPRGPRGLGAGNGPRSGAHAAAEAIDREHLLNRLQHLRGILPIFAEELASARRQSAALRVENRGLLEEVRRLRRERERSSAARGSAARGSAARGSAAR